MASPPTYEESTAHDGGSTGWSREVKYESKAPHHFGICEEVGISRSQHVATLVSKLLPHIRTRAQQGLARSAFLLLPSDQSECSKKGELVGYPEEDRPILIQLEGRYDVTQFWTQQEALDLLRAQLLRSLIGADEVSNTRLPERPPPPRPSPPTARSSFFGRKSTKVLESPAMALSVEPRVKVVVELDQANFRSETPFGLFETLRGRAVMVSIDAR